MKLGLQQLFGKRGTQNKADDAQERRLAIAQLLLEIARSDMKLADAEMAVIRAHLASAYALDDAQLDELVASAKQRVEQSVSLYDTVRIVNAALSAEDKAELMRALWQVAYADQKLDPYEEALLRRLAELLYVPHEVFIREKLKLLQ